MKSDSDGVADGENAQFSAWLYLVAATHVVILQDMGSGVGGGSVRLVARECCSRSCEGEELGGETQEREDGGDHGGMMTMTMMRYAML